MSKVTPCLWFSGNAEEAARHYVSLLPDSRIDRVVHTPVDTPGNKAGETLLVEFTLGGRRFTALNGGPQFRFNEAISFQIACEDQAEVDRLTEALSADPHAEQCGWVKDRYGVSWQIVPTAVMRYFSDPDPARAQRAIEAVLQMKRIDIAAVERAANGIGAPA